MYTLIFTLKRLVVIRRGTVCYALPRYRPQYTMVSLTYHCVAYRAITLIQILILAFVPSLYIYKIKFEFSFYFLYWVFYYVVSISRDYSSLATGVLSVVSQMSGSCKLSNKMLMEAEVYKTVTYSWLKYKHVTCYDKEFPFAKRKS